jgi:tRNA (guanine-N7-)-methyltransferase
MSNWENPYKTKLQSFPNLLFEECFLDDRFAEHLKAIESKSMLEIGCGSGSHIIELAKRSPQYHFFGIEKRYKRAVRCVEKAAELQLTNLCILRGDFFKTHSIFPAHFFSGVFCNFPDPWEKKRWQKHRMLSSDGLELLKNLLVPGGFLSLKTDHPQFFSDTRALIERSQPEWNISSLVSDLHHNIPMHMSNVQSEFEALFRSKQKPVNFLIAHVSPGAAPNAHPYFDNIVTTPSAHSSS